MSKIKRFGDRNAYIRQTTKKYVPQIDYKDMASMNRDLTKSACFLFMYMSAKKRQWTFNLKQIADDLKIPYDTICRAKTELLKKGYLHIEHGKRNDNIFLGKDIISKIIKGVKA